MLTRVSLYWMHTIKYQTVINGITTTYDTAVEVQNAINSLPAGTYKINYVITHNGSQTAPYRIVTLT